MDSESLTMILTKKGLVNVRTKHPTIGNVWDINLQIFEAELSWCSSPKRDRKINPTHVPRLSIRSMGLWSTRASAGALKSQHVVKHVSSWLQVTPWQDHDTMDFLHWLVVSTYPSEQYESQWEGWHPIYEMENNPVIFETTNQYTSVTSVISAPQHAVQDRCTPRCFRWRYRWSTPELCGISLQLLPKKRKEQCHTVQSLCLVGNGWNRNGHLGRLDKISR